MKDPLKINELLAEKKWQENFDRQDAKKKASPVDSWRNYWEALERQKKIRNADREEMMPKNMVCPKCRQTKLSCRQWPNDQVRWKKHKRALAEREEKLLSNPPNKVRKAPAWVMECRACDKAPEPKGEAKEYLTCVLMYLVDVRTVYDRRRELKLSQATLSGMCGWKQPKQCRMETPGRRFSQDDLQELQAHLQLEEIPGTDPQPRYYVDGPAMQATREALGLPRSSVAASLGCNPSRVVDLERASQTEVEAFTAERLLLGLCGITGE